MRITLAAALLLVAFSAPAGTISSLDPASFQAYSGEHFISVRGQQLGGQLIFDGPAGRIEVEPSSADQNLVKGFVPTEIINTPGQYSLRVGDSNTVTFDVIEPFHALVVLGQDPIVVEAESARGAHVTYEVHTYGGHDPNPTVTCNPPSGSLFPLGPSNVLCVATNSYGERAEGGVYIYVYDATIPVLTLPGDIVVETDSQDGTVVNFEATAYDAIDGEVSVSCTPSSGSLFPVGVTMVECTAFDSSLNPATGMFSVEVKQKEGDPPQLFIQVPSDIEIEAETSAGAVVTFAVTTHGSTDPEPVVTCSPASESVFPRGITQVVCIATDIYGLRAEGSFLVKVTDTTPPDVRTTDLSVQGSSGGGAVVEYDIVGVDVVDGEIAAKCEPPSGTRFPAGTTTVQCSATDSSGNVGRGTFTVTVSGTSTPVLYIQVPDDFAVEAEGADGAIVTFTVTTHGSTDPNPTVTCNPASGSLFALGSTTVNCSASDSYGQTVEGSFDLTVIDTIAPNVQAEDITVQATSSTGAVVEYEVIADDLVDGEIVATCSPASGSQFPTGTTTVQCTATDGAGNSGTGAFTVTVVESDKPVLFLQVPDDIAVEADGADGRVVTFTVTTNGSSDPNPSVSCTPSSGSLFAVGTTTVRCTATDSYGQSVERSFDVNVVDTIAPIISSVTATPNVLVPANHKLVDVEVTIEAADGIDPMPQCSVVDVTANEPVDGPGSGNTKTDWRITGALTLELRAERSGEGSDRLYHVHVSCFDASGNAAHDSVDVVVPKSSSNEQDAVIDKGSSRRRSVGRGR
jgi:hypothetical protein